MRTFILTLALLQFASLAQGQLPKTNVPYVENGHERHVLDIYSPAGAKNLPVVFWIHGGGWQGGDKSDVQIKPKIFNEQGLVFVSTNYRLLPHVDMSTLIGDVAKSLGWVHKNIAAHGGDPQRILVMGHSAGAQLAAILCTDDRYLKTEGVPFTVLKGCVPVDGDTYDIPAIITTVEMRNLAHGLAMPEYGHRVKFGNDPKKHLDFSAVTHVAKGKNIPPFLILHVAGHPDVSSQARRFGQVLEKAEVPVTVFGAKETTHNKLNADLGLPEDAATKELLRFVEKCIAPKP
ncbi:alpha/beta hydrolase [Anatilimnocola floriformis]|uniref:alpha/beta hydrolase n=1 Tax=Anatilimnocola floriformis TaxID=2948575 RepID=UPI0020C2302B|nr:alpha/beta hydrolase [Anatilimnocola floriformis]